MWWVFVSCWHSHVFSWPEHNVLFCLDYLALLWTKRFNYLAPEKGLVLLMYQHRKQSESRILNDIPTLHSMAIDLTSCHDKPSHWLGMEVDSLWNHSEGDPCVDWVTNRMKKMSSCGRLLHSKCNDADEGRQGWYSVPDSWLHTTAFLWGRIYNLPSFSSYSCRCVCFVSITTRFIHTHTHASGESYWNFCSRSLSPVNKMAPVGQYHKMNLRNTITAI